MGRKSNKKKKGGGRTRAPAQPNSGINAPVVEALADAFVDREEETSNPIDRGITYAKYKQATTAFRDGLANLLPATLLPLETVDELGNAVDHLLSQEAFIPSKLLKNLEESIRLRTTVMESYGGDEDEGHKYMLNVLMYCRSTLQHCRRLYRASSPRKKKSSSPSDKGDDDTPDVIKSRFDVLHLDSDDESDAADYDSGHHAGESKAAFDDLASNERPKTPKQSYSIGEDLIGGTTLFHALSFISTINGLAGEVDSRFAWLKWAMTELRSMKPERENAIAVGLLMRTTAPVNMVIEEARYIEESLRVDCPQLATFYHVLATLFYRREIAHLEEMMDPSRLSSDPHICLNFIAERIEHGFRTPMDPLFHEMPKLADAFAKSAVIPPSDAFRCR